MPKSTIRAAKYWQTVWQKDFALKNGISQDQTSLSLTLNSRAPCRTFPRSGGGGVEVPIRARGLFCESPLFDNELPTLIKVT